MDSIQRLNAALKGQRIDQIPVVPKIWVDYAAHVTKTNIENVITDLLTALRVIALAGRKLGVDGFGNFIFP